MKVKNILLVLLSLILIIISIFGVSSLVYGAPPPSYVKNNDICACYVTVEACEWQTVVWIIPYWISCKKEDFSLRVGETIQCTKEGEQTGYYDCIIDEQTGKFTVKKMPDNVLISNKGDNPFGPDGEEGYLGDGRYKVNLEDIKDVERCTKKNVVNDKAEEPSRTACTPPRTKINESDYYQTIPSEELSSEENKDLCCTVTLGDDVEAFQFSGDSDSRDGPYADGVTNVIKVKKGTPITYGFWWRHPGSDESKPSSWKGAYDGRTVCDSDVKEIPTDEHKTSVWKLPNDNYMARFGETYPLFVEIDPIKREDRCGVKVRKTKKSPDQITQTPLNNSSSGNTVIGGGSSNTINKTQNDSQTSSNQNNNDKNSVSLSCGCDIKINDDVRVSDEKLFYPDEGKSLTLGEFVEGKKIKRGSSVLYKYGVDVYENEKDATAPFNSNVPLKRNIEIKSKICQGNEDIVLPSNNEIQNLVSSSDTSNGILKVILSKYGNARPFLLDVQINEQDLCGGEASYDPQEGTIAPEFNVFTIIITLLVSLLTISIIRVRKKK